ncbi:unnamed protein product [Porites evermanni]|uniref:DUF1907 domain-containing protein n=1 Tax=Porites evermanni TaxID=104178 RepID=A0ABN8T505_9CNID|nr:unnamed protein product [Porites evermanni]
MYDLVRIPLPLLKSSVGAVRKVSPNWSQDTMTCHSSNCFVWGKGNVPLLNPDKTKVSVSDMFKGLDLRVEHFHCFSDHGEGGHYHYDVTPDEVQYSGFFNLAEKIYRIDRPLVTHSVGRD